MKTTARKVPVEKIVIPIVAVVVLGLLIFFLSDVFFPFIKLEIAQDVEGAKALLLSKGFIGFITVSIIEALQMVVIFIPAEFIQLSSGMAYPWWLAVILCDVGVSLGASIIYLLVNVFRFRGDVISKNKIEKYEQRSKTKSAVLLMYVLFIMPIIPFGAICYYGSSKKIPYPRYLLTCATGVIPSIFSSIVLGQAIKEFIANSLPIWALVLIIIAAAALLFTLLLIVLKRNFFNFGKDSPTPWFIALCEKVIISIMTRKTKFNIVGADQVRKIDGPFIYLAAHHSSLDAMSVYNIAPEKNIICVVNEYYFRLPIIGKILKKAGHIKKKMFHPDILCVKNIMRTIQGGTPVMLFPEGRLSTDGGPSYIDEKAAALCKKLRVPIVLVELKNNYFIAPKWRSGVYRGTCDVTVKRVITPDELENMDSSELISLIRDGLSYNEFSGEEQRFRSANKAKGLHGILYMCPHCRAMYSNISYKNTLECKNCGKKYHIAENYQFEETDIPNIYKYYGKIKQIERENLADVSLDVPVDVRIFKDGVKKIRTEKGVFHLDSEKVSFRSELTDLYFEYSIDNLEGIAYSVNQEFEMYYKDELYYFYPTKDDRAVCTRVALLFEMMKEERYENGKR